MGKDKSWSAEQIIRALADRQATEAMIRKWKNSKSKNSDSKSNALFNRLHNEKEENLTKKMMMQIEKERKELESVKSSPLREKLAQNTQLRSVAKFLEDQVSHEKKKNAKLEKKKTEIEVKREDPTFIPEINEKSRKIIQAK